MKKFIISVLLLAALSVNADENPSVHPSADHQYRECVAVSLYTVQRRELNSMVKNNREIEDSTAIPEGWSVVGVTSKQDAESDMPYLVICH